MKILPEEEFVDRRIHKSEFLDPESESDQDDMEFIDRYDSTGRILKNQDSSAKSENVMNRSMKDRSILSMGSPIRKSGITSQQLSPGGILSAKGSVDRVVFG